MIGKVKNRLRTLGARVTVYILLLALIPLVATSILLYNEVRQSYIQGEQTNLENQAGIFLAWLEEWEIILEQLSRQNVIREQGTASANYLLEARFQQSAYYDALFLIDEDGQLVAGATRDAEEVRTIGREEAEEIPVINDAWFDKALSGETAFSEPYMSRLSGSEVVTQAVPVEVNGEISGVVAGSVSMSEIHNQMDNLILGEDSEAYLVDGEGIPVTTADSVRGVGEPLETRAAEAINRQESGMDFYDNAAGEPVLGRYTHIPHLGWGLILETEEEAVLGPVHDIQYTLAAILVVTVIIVMVAALFISRKITRPITEVATTADIIAGGDFTSEVPPHLLKREDEIGRLAASFNSMGENLSHLIKRAVDTATGVNEGSESVSSAAEEMNASLQEISSTTNEFAGQTQQMSDSSQKMAENSSSISEKANQGQQAIKDVNRQMELIGEKVKNLQQAINQVNQRSDDIEGILQVITDMSEQTNLLALNAAIEAARAGEHGKGFTVVAEEVRKLAERSAQSASEISEIVQATQQDSKQALEEMDQGVKEVDEGSRVIENAGKTFQEIIDEVGEVSSQIESVASAAQELSSGSQEVAATVQEQSSTMEELSASAEELRSSAEQLFEELKKFKYS